MRSFFLNGFYKREILPCLCLASTLLSFESGFVDATPNILGDHGGIHANPAHLEKNPDNVSTLGFSTLDNEELSTLYMDYQGTGWGAGYLYNRQDSASRLILGLSEHLGKDLYIGSKLSYHYRRGPNYFTTDLGALWEWHAGIKWAYHVRGLFLSEKAPDGRTQHLALGLRPLWFLNRGDFLTASYQMNGNGFRQNMFRDGTHAIYGDIRLSHGIHIQGRHEVVNGRNWSLGANIQVIPNQIIGMFNHREGNRWEYYNRIHMANRKPYLLPPGKVTVLDLNLPVIEGRVSDTWFSSRNTTGHLNVLEQIESFDMPGIRAVVVKAGHLNCSQAIAGEIRTALHELRKKRGVKILVYLEQTSRLNYYLASIGDKIILPPSGYFDVRAYAAEVSFYKGLLEKVGVEAQFVKRGKYKSYPEVFTQEEMSEFWRANMESNLESLWEEYLNAVGRARGIHPDSLRRILARPNISLDSSMAYGLVDTLLYEDQLTEYVLGRPSLFYKLPHRAAIDPRWSRGPSIAVIYMTGAIMPGESRSGGLLSMQVAGSETMVRLLQKVRYNSSIKALVLRVDSPGGSAVSSDIVLRELELVKKSGKPVIVSVGNVCASGCYYVAAGADNIYASENSIVGSIGIFGGKFVAKGLYDKLGIQKEVITTNRHADAHSSYRKWDSTEVVAVQAYMDSFYERFTGNVAAFRELSDEQVSDIAQGRVFTGIQARKNKLVDHMGGLEDAVREAKRRVGLKPDHRVHLQVLNGKYTPTLFGSLEEQSAKAWLQNYRDFIRQLQSIKMWALAPEALFMDL